MKIKAPLPLTFNKAEEARSNKVSKNLTPSGQSKKAIPLAFIFATLLFSMLSFSCKKELSCASCQAINKPPVAIAGSDQVITLPTDSLILDGSASNDPDGTISKWLWTKISGPSAGIANPETAKTAVKNVVAGVYKFELKVTDEQGLSATDTITVTVALPVDSKQHTPCTDCRIAFVSDRSGDMEIYSCKSDGSNIQRLTNSSGDDDQPAWSPDGTHIAFVSGRSGTYEIYTINADGSNVVRRTFTGNFCNSPTWSPDGTRIAYSMSTNGSYNTSLWVVEATGGSPSLLFDGKGMNLNPAWSPDGTKITFARDSTVSENYDIYTIRPTGTGLTDISPVINLFDKEDYIIPSWSPNGSKLAMIIRQTTGLYQYTTQIGVTNADGSGVKAFPTAPMKLGTAISWSADGTKIAYTSMSGSTKNIS
ncbi:TolB family protein [Pinibacter soli]|uniref:PKD domain-containing protein n=1 Tax=Pinibacter soli TaxID=3044211 RepID=A0ABT6REF3_9BACT|nr:PKD domain-containing protein [Pinibacter soli]MDI3320962.1 PKD domain-containing protein [Pinibacter soli]